MWLAYLSMVLLMVVGLLLMVVILLQRGRGGGLAGAFGGAGGQSAFGTRAGDVFTKITAALAIIWVILAGVSRFALEPASHQIAAELPSEADLEKGKVPNLEATGDETKDEANAPPTRPGDEPPALPEKTEPSNVPEPPNAPDNNSSGGGGT